MMDTVTRRTLRGLDDFGVRERYVSIFRSIVRSIGRPVSSRRIDTSEGTYRRLKQEQVGHARNWERDKGRVACLLKENLANWKVKRKPPTISAVIFSVGNHIL